MKKMAKEKQKAVEETQEILFDTFHRLTRKYCEAINNDDEIEMIGRHVRNLSLAIMALNGKIDTYKNRKLIELCEEIVEYIPGHHLNKQIEWRDRLEALKEG